MNQLRTSPRVQLVSNLKVYLGNTQRLIGYVNDLSERGIGLLCDYPVEWSAVVDTDEIAYFRIALPFRISGLKDFYVRARHRCSN